MWCSIKKLQSDPCPKADFRKSKPYITWPTNVRAHENNPIIMTPMLRRFQNCNQNRLCNRQSWFCSSSAWHSVWLIGEKAQCCVVTFQVQTAKELLAFVMAQFEPLRDVTHCDRLHTSFVRVEDALCEPIFGGSMRLFFSFSALCFVSWHGRTGPVASFRDSFPLLM